MRLTQYGLQLDEEKRTILVKESARNVDMSQDMLNHPDHIMDLMEKTYKVRSLAEEYAWILALNQKFRLIGIFELSHGGGAATMIGVREIFIRLCLLGAAQFIVLHNHPSGDPTPSGADLSVTEKLISAGVLLEIPLVDHIVLGDSYYSMQEHGIVE